MKWTVSYRPTAKDRLATLWLDAANKREITSAADLIDRILLRSPLTAGESREGNSRLLIVPPLSVVFDVYPDDRLVDVLYIQEWR
jgi:hypothetical protein